MSPPLLSMLIASLQEDCGTPRLVDPALTELLASLLMWQLLLDCSDSIMRARLADPPVICLSCLFPYIALMHVCTHVYILGKANTSDTHNVYTHTVHVCAHARTHTHSYTHYKIVCGGQNQTCSVYLPNLELGGLSICTGKEFLLYLVPWSKHSLK